MIKPTSFLLEHNAESGIAIITLNRPERLNALTFDVYTELRDTFRSLETDAHIRTIIITGTGKAFCSGGDVHEIIGDLVKSDEKKALVLRLLVIYLLCLLVGELLKKHNIFTNIMMFHLPTKVK